MSNNELQIDLRKLVIGTIRTRLKVVRDITGITNNLQAMRYCVSETLFHLIRRNKELIKDINKIDK